MGDASLQNFITIKCILRCLDMASSLKVNFLKSCCVGLCVPDEEIRMFASILNCKVTTLPFLYLGIPIGGKPRRTALWKPILEKMRRKLSAWKQKMLSVEGRVCLINNVLTAIPLFFVSFFRIPKGVLKEVKRIMRTFLWGGSELDPKIAWVK
ncbi:uncharacterized protein LOC130725381 [Lotus japonicus]|uniref:uncharacterized protein LOC130725381 n=1 Tax=Lotus japonicus TaxID=34305 RepID=UPI00258F959E|nr:uncharacterized protein LOC130725381 [Lotus japonicus]